MEANRGRIEEVQVSKIKAGERALREAKTESEEFEFLKRSIEKEGVLQSITVRETIDEETGEEIYILIDGLQRVAICELLNYDTIPAQILDADESKTLSLQIQANLHNIKTKPAEYGRAIMHYLALNDDVTISQLAEEMNVSPAWITARMNLSKLVPEIQESVDNGDIPLTNAQQLAKLPADEQLQWVKRASEQSPEVFVEAAKARLEQIKTAQRAGKKAGAETFKLLPRVRSKTDILDEQETHKARADLVTDNMTPVEAFDLAIDWVLRVDPKTEQIEREKWEQEQEAKRKRAEERRQREEAKKAEESEALVENAQ